MTVWDNYEARLEINGKTRRERALKRTRENITNKSVNSLSSHKVLINSNPQTVTILNQREDLALKKILALPGETLVHGGLVDFANDKWLITELDANDEVYASGFMQRCNYVLRWLNKEGKIIEKHCVVEDGTKYLIGEYRERIMAIGDARFALTIGKDEDTVELDRGRRFLIDDIDSKEVLAFEITKPNRLFNIYDNKGVFRYILNEVNLTDNDNVELRIADYYNWKPDMTIGAKHEDKDISLEEIIENGTKEDTDESGWL